MLLVVDVGNTNTVIGVYNKKKLKTKFRITTNQIVTSDEIVQILYNFLAIHRIDKDNIEDTIISSVAPDVLYSWQSANRKFFGREAMIVGIGTKTGIDIKYDNPREVGADRVVDAVAAYEMYGGPTIVVDLGTASTFDVVNKHGQYLGGSIAPGLKTSLDALIDRTAQLPRIELHDPSSAIAKNTSESINAGMVFGYIGLIDGIIEQLIKEIIKKENITKEEINIVSTGGYSELLASESRYIEIVENDLTLEGLRLIYERTIKK